LLDDILFNVPDNLPSAEIVIDAKTVKEKLDSIVKNRDLSKFIL